MKLNIGENLRRLRRAADMTQEQLADKLGVAYQSVYTSGSFDKARNPRGGYISYARRA